jgi:hypothetical protein
MCEVSTAIATGGDGNTLLFAAIASRMAVARTMKSALLVGSFRITMILCGLFFVVFPTIHLPSFVAVVVSQPTIAPARAAARMMRVSSFTSLLVERLRSSTPMQHAAP